MLKNECILFIRELLEEALSCLNDISDENSIERLYSLLHISMEYVRLALENRRNIEMDNTFRVKELINRVTELIEYQLRIRGMSIAYNVPEDELYARGDSQSFTRALLYIFMEVIKLHDKYEDLKTIYISAAETNNNGNITVKFTLKNRLPLSFSYAQQLIEQAGGSVSVLHSDDEVSVVIGIPLFRDGFRKNCLKVLVVDDDPLIRELFTDFLQMLGEECIVCDSYKRALEIIKISSPDIVLVDYNMPEMNGIEFIKMASKFIDRKRLCILTGELASSLLSRFEEGEKVKVIEKPVTLSKIRDFLLKYKESECSM